MKDKFIVSAWLLLAVCWLASGCGEEKYTGPESVEPSQVNEVINNAFADASEEVKNVVQETVSSYAKGDFTKSSSILQALLSRKDITDEQRQTGSRCLMTVNDEMQRSIQEKGDRKAEQYLKYRNATK